MARKPLARVVDPSQLDASAGAWGKLRLRVPAGWLTAGAALTVEVPKRLLCARCDGGGCDSCGRSGAHKLSGGGHELQLHLPGGSARGVQLRLVEPFEGSVLAQLIVEVCAGEEPSPNVRRSRALVASPAESASVLPWVVMVLALALLAWFGLR